MEEENNDISEKKLSEKEIHIGIMVAIIDIQKRLDMLTEVVESMLRREKERLEFEAIRKEIKNGEDDS